MQRYVESLFVLATMAGTAIAAVTSPSIVPPVKPVLSAVDKLGYEAPTEVSYDDGAWQVEVLKQNKPVEVRLDLKSHEVLSTHADEPHPTLPKMALGMAAIVEKLEAAGYGPIKHLEFEDNAWEADVFHNNSWREVELDLTGKIIRDELDD